MFKRLAFLAAAGCCLLANPALAATGGGATIHNAATLTFSGGEMTATVDVSVLTVGAAPVISVSGPANANAGDVAVLTYTITSTSNGLDSYTLNAGSTDTDVGAPALTVTPPVISLGASITSRPSTADAIYIAAGSETGLDAGDTVRITIGGTDYLYEITSVTPGTPAFTVGNTTTPEQPTMIVLSNATSGAPAIGAGDVPAGVQIGEVATFTVNVTAGAPTVPGSGGNHTVEITGETTAPGPGGTPENFTDGGNGVVTVFSGEAVLTKEVRNVTTGTAFASTGTTARSGDVLEYRLTASSLPGETVSGAVLEDSLPEHTSYVADSTQLNGNPVADDTVGATLLPLDEGGLQINTPSGVAGELVDGESAVILFRVSVN
ncbi:DUF11 domain-containing protein [Isoalcanivorax indicus]|uniref:DUF11 domain-containing protein n=1 Tax=Isoalcanivorax indicus TaxID=2202653 RepID=UPI000DBA50FD|nr:DUF11 domain-containing protein [Isoalcanivorax indicus]